MAVGTEQRKGDSGKRPELDMAGSRTSREKGKGAEKTRGQKRSPRHEERAVKVCGTRQAGRVARRAREVRGGRRGTGEVTGEKIVQ